MMDPKIKRVLLLGVSCFLSTAGIFLLMAALGVLGHLPMAAGMAGFAVCTVLSFVAILFAFRQS
jgi:hypothetical protein